MRSHSSSIAWIICPADTESIEDANCRRFAPFSPAGADADREATNRSTCSCVSGGSFSTCLVGHFRNTLTYFWAVTQILSRSVQLVEQLSQVLPSEFPFKG